MPKKRSGKKKTTTKAAGSKKPTGRPRLSLVPKFADEVEAIEWLASVGLDQDAIGDFFEFIDHGSCCSFQG